MISESPAGGRDDWPEVDQGEVQLVRSAAGRDEFAIECPIRDDRERLKRMVRLRLDPRLPAQVDSTLAAVLGISEAAIKKRSCTPR